jgi:MFS family permease
VPGKPRESGTFSKRSLWGLNAANFFQAEMVGVILPVLNGYLKDSGWRYDSIGAAAALAGLGALLFQTPAGIVTDRISKRRGLFGGAALGTGVLFALIPAARYSVASIDSLLFAAGLAQTLFWPAARGARARTGRTSVPQPHDGHEPGMESRW